MSTSVSSLWLFGYGSLIWNPGFVYAERRRATLQGWKLRFWQGSEDHRGTPESPGRVATLVRCCESRVTGAVYRLEGDTEAILAYLDHREQGGYERLSIEVATEHGPVSALIYIGGEHRREFIGPEEEALTASIIASSVGPSGANIDYLLHLQKALSDLGASDPHVDSLVSLLKAVG